MKKHPIQPLEKVDGVLRFKRNHIVSHLLDHGKIDMNAIAIMDFSNEDRQQFAQLIGYSLSGYAELPYVDEDAYGVANLMVGAPKESDARIRHLDGELKALRKALLTPMARLFGVHPDDLRKNP